jgi:enamine deaminase RidA (YjgF/YER057c/UK114 family)
MQRVLGQQNVESPSTRCRFEARELRTALDYSTSVRDTRVAVSIDAWSSAFCRVASFGEIGFNPSQRRMSVDKYYAEGLGRASFYSHAVKVPGLIFCSGQIPAREDGSIVEGIQAGAKQCISNLEKGRLAVSASRLADCFGSPES